jgi:hypothetical protein
MDCILKEDQYLTIFKVSFLLLGSCIYAIWNGYYHLSIYPGGVFLTSINYWRKPDYSWRRYLDMCYVHYALITQGYKVYNAQYAMEYYTLSFIACCFFLLGIYYYKRKLYWHSTYAHCALHIFSNVANVVVYSGQIE